MSLIDIDPDKAEVAACRTKLAYDLSDELWAYADEDLGMVADALGVLLVVAAFTAKQLGVTESQLLLQSQETFRAVGRGMKRAGKSPLLKDVMVEMHLDHRPDRKKRSKKR